MLKMWKSVKVEVVTLCVMTVDVFLTNMLFFATFYDSRPVLMSNSNETKSTNNTNYIKNVKTYVEILVHTDLMGHPKLVQIGNLRTGQLNS